MSFEPRDYLRHILVEIEYLSEAAQDVGRDEFLRDPTLRRAFVRSLVSMRSRRLHPDAFCQAVEVLGRRDPDLGDVVARFGPPPRWIREPGFPTLVRIILEQQVSLASARAAFERLLETVGELTPRSFLTLDDEILTTVGFSRQKTSYCRGLAETLQAGALDLEALEAQPDETVRATLQNVRGIGRWTAEVYLLMALERPDVWPVGDLALRVAVQQVKGLPERPEADALQGLAEPWRPWRTVAAHILWHHYLSVG